MVVAAGVAGAIVSGAASVDQTSTVPRLGSTTPQTLPFVRIGQTYVITWPDRAVDVVAPREIVGSWVRVDHSGGRARWINLAAALSIDEKSG
jgi:hypothetical protein